ncbi:hypothetical protein E2320_002366 [Naja naja]|nr:hypothetical protein E2320_002366 [Naja naja]
MSTKEEIITRAMALHNTLGLSTARPLWHNYKDRVLSRRGGDFCNWRDPGRKSGFMLMHDKHYYGVKTSKVSWVHVTSVKCVTHVTTTNLNMIANIFVWAVRVGIRDEVGGETGTHIPNYVYAMDMLEDGNVRRWEWYGEKCLEEFVKTFVQPKFNGATFIAHNSKSYDGYLILRQLIREKIHVFEEGYHRLAPLDNYQKSKKSFSACSIQWLLYIEHTEGIHIQHALQGGEKKVGIYFLDGFAVINGVLTAFEFYGCFFHGCPICYKPQDFNSLLDSTYGMLTREDYLKSEGYVVRGIWEHEWNDMLKNNEGLKRFLAGHAFFGGRTNATCLYYKPKQGEQILYYDFTSLYPFVNKNKAYPIGHPEIIYQNFGDIKQYFGFKVKVYPPRASTFRCHTSRGKINEASGYPDWCKTEEDKDAMFDYKKNGGPIMPQIAKLFLNSLGQIGQSTNHLTTMVVTEPEELFMYLFCPCEFVDDEAAVLTWKAAKNQPTKEGAWSPSLGDYLGQLTSEIPPNTSITEFAAAGPKTYGYALSNGSTVLKVKGITLNSANSVKVNFESLKDLINEYCLTGGVEKKEIKVQQQGLLGLRNGGLWKPGYSERL